MGSRVSKLAMVHRTIAFAYGEVLRDPGPPVACIAGKRSATGGSGGNAPCGSAWYQYATEE